MPWGLFMEIICRRDRVRLNMVQLFLPMNKSLAKGNAEEIGALKRD
jgi:hypothetical protein